MLIYFTINFIKNKKFDKKIVNRFILWNGGSFFLRVNFTKLHVTCGPNCRKPHAL